MDQEEWIIRSNKSADGFAAFVIAFIGAAMTFLARHSAQDRNGRAGYWLGCLLLAAGGAIGCETKSGLRVYSVGAQCSIVAAVIAVGLYAAWFRLRVGPWCPAMWFGSAPPLLIIVFFFTVRGVMRYWPEE